MKAREERYKQESGNDYNALSVLAKFLLFVWSWGTHCSEAKAKEDVDEMHSQYRRSLKKHRIDEEVEIFSDLSAFASIGNHGLWGNNCHRDRVKLLPENHIAQSEPVSVKLPNRILIL